MKGLLIGLVLLVEAEAACSERIPLSGIREENLRYC